MYAGSYSYKPLGVVVGNEIKPASPLWGQNRPPAKPVVLTDPEGNRHIIRTAKGGNRSFAREHIDDALLAKTKHLHIASINMLPKLGEKGVYVTDFHEKYYLPSFYRQKPVDTTGAGDGRGNAGYTSVMFDGSKLPFEENLSQTRKLSELRRQGLDFLYFA